MSESKRIHIKELSAHIGKEASISGWVHGVRKQGSLVFVLLRDISGLLQVVVTKESEKALEIAKELRLESVIEVTGLVKEEKQAPDGYEMLAKEITVYTEAEPELPIQVVGRKTANLIVSVCFDQPAICVDTHVHRIMNYIGYVKTSTPLETEKVLREKLPKKLWTKTNYIFVLLGQTSCSPANIKKPSCPLNWYTLKEKTVTASKPKTKAKKKVTKVKKKA